jgi:hypothetical protein
MFGLGSSSNTGKGTVEVGSGMVGWDRRALARLRREWLRMDDQARLEREWLGWDRRASL